jgi:nickel superoxide dismutase
MQIREHVTTIEKAMVQIDQLTSDKSSAQNMNQLVRWINTKEEHATFIQSIMTDYFLAQRIKPKQKNEAGRQQYVDQTLLLQQIIVAGMKCKQTVDKSKPELVSILLNQFVELYFNEHGKEHLNAMQKG